MRYSQSLILFSVFSLLIICPATSLAWHDYGSYWDYHGSGRDIPYSVYIDHYTPGYAEYPLAVPEYIDAVSYFNKSTTPAIMPLSPAPITPVPLLPPAQPDEFTVNIPNDHGGYTTILIRRSGNGFIGPQGEYYPQFPKVSQLKIMYGK